MLTELIAGKWRRGGGGLGKSSTARFRWSPAKVERSTGSGASRRGRRSGQRRLGLHGVASGSGRRNSERRRDAEVALPTVSCAKGRETGVRRSAGMWGVG